MGMVRRGELTTKAWGRIAPLLPDNADGSEGRDHRQMINAILWKLGTGASWQDLPGRYGPWETVRERLRGWTTDGTWQKILDEAVVKDDAVGEVEWSISGGTAVAHLHERAAGGRKEGAALIRSRPSLWPATAADALEEE